MITLARKTVIATTEKIALIISTVINTKGTKVAPYKKGQETPAKKGRSLSKIDMNEE